MRPLLSIGALLPLIIAVLGYSQDLGLQTGNINANGQLDTEYERLIRLHRARNASRIKRDAKAAIKGASPCTGDFQQPEYQLSTFQFNQTTVEAGDRSMTHFELIDVANNISTPCTTPYLQDPSDPVWNECADGSDPIDPKTVFKFTASTTKLELSQMWICELGNKTHPHIYFSSASIDLTKQLNCVDDPTQTRCTVADDAVSPFNGDYVTPVWKSAEVTIPPSTEGDKETPRNEFVCFGTSFSYPNWDVQDFTSGGGDNGDSVTFRLNNHANNQSVACTIQKGEWTSCDDSTRVRFTEESSEIAVIQTWTCNGVKYYSTNVTFQAVGSAPIDLDSTNSTYIKGSLTKPIEITPDVSPQGVNYPGCLETSEAPSWIVTSWVWNEAWKAGYNTGNLTATFYNPATGYNMTCTGEGEGYNRDGRYGLDEWSGCALESSPFSDYQIRTMINLNAVTGVFSIDQTWFCNGHDDKLPSEFRARGGAETTLECAWQNDTATNINIKTCYQTEPFTVHGNITKQEELTKDIFFEMQPSGYSCTMSSVLATQWQAFFNYDVLYAQPLFPNTFEAKVYFSIVFMALEGYQSVAYVGTSVTPGLPNYDPDRWYDCWDYIRNEVTSSVWARNSIECKWQLDLATGYFAINHTWFCDDKTPEQPIIFHGEGSRFFNYSCYIYGRDDDEFECDPVEANPRYIMPTSLSWKSVSVEELQGLIGAY
ncbi:hypothetical protein M426DRAFT_257510 [Hypoxylon sp. CI-4A]|nr:hypothetical protein M426DRAFT_257510 [Hypoxylon sp. CI-4A]